MASISNVINATLLPQPAAAAADNMNVVAIFTSSQDGPINSADRYRLYTDSASVSSDFGTTSDVAAYARAFFGTQPNAVNAGGVLVVAYWRGAEEVTDATAATLEGAQLTETTVVDSLQQVSDGTLDIDIDGVTENLTALDFQTALDLEDVAGVIDTELTGGAATVDNSAIVITSATTGATSTISFATDPGTGTFVGDTLALTDGSGATTTQGEASATLTAETQLEALGNVKSEINFKGAMFIAAAPGEREDLASWAEANATLLYEVFDDPTNLNVATTNTVWTIKLKGQDNYRMLYRKDGNRKFAATYMARVHTVNFNADSSAMTMNLKELNIAAEQFTQTEITNAENVGLDIYTTIKNTPLVLTSPANDFVDNVYNLLAYVDNIETDLFNVLKLTGTKVPQTQAGVNQLVDQAEQTSERFVNAGVFAPGTWTLPDTFGDRDTFLRNVSQRGYYVMAGSLADQPTADRQARKSPVLQIAVKNAGAIHKADVIINFNL